MNRTSRHVVFATAFFALAITSVSGLEPGFRSIFNGRDLTGWDGAPSYWSVRDGSITGVTTPEQPTRGNTFIIWRAGTLRDFELRLEYRLVGGNSGIQYRSRELLDEHGKWVVGGYQADFEAGKRFNGILYEEKGRGILAMRGTKVQIGADGKKQVVGKTDDPDAIQGSIKSEEWNEYTIVAEGNRLVHKINGLTTIEVEDQQEGHARAAGLLALQLHAGPPMTVQFRNIRLRDPRSPGGGGGLGLDGAQWIWRDTESPDGELVHFRKTVELASDDIESARIAATCDNHVRVWVNDKRVIDHGDWQAVAQADVKRHLSVGKNVIAVRGINEGSIAGLILKFEAKLGDGREMTAVTDASWRLTGKEAEGWRRAEFDDSDWARPHVHGEFGVGPWGRVGPTTGGSGAIATDPATLVLPEGFRAELLYAVPKPLQGSWVSLTLDDKGRLITSDQYGELYRITAPPLGAGSDETFVERLDVKLGSAHGLLHAFGSLYVVVNGNSHGQSSGLYRLRDTDGDDQYDSVEKLKGIQGGGEHGPHAVLKTPDGEGLYVLGGNHTKVPEGLAESSPTPMVWQEDLLLPRQWDARGHARGVLAPGGWICRTDPDGEKWEILSNGYRNQYDAAVSPDGELLTFDADMEWDMGTPWYRPTRVCHAVSGSEFGWRSGTGKWPPYFVDSLPPVADIGPGSPTGAVFGTGANFPKKYQDAFYVLDWTFGTMYAVHLKPAGASYTGEIEEFVSGRPLPLTDAVVGGDGALYFTIGGRRTQSALYRVTYHGEKETDTADEKLAGELAQAREARALRRHLETLHGRKDPKIVDEVWNYLGHPDRFIRFAARIALEHQDVQGWQERAFAETSPRVLLNALVALSRQASGDLQPRVLEALERLELGSLEVEDQLALLRVHALCFIRMGKPDAEAARAVAGRLDGLYPSDDDRLNRELSRVLVYLDWPPVISKTLALMEASSGQDVETSEELLQRNPGYGNTILDMLRKKPALQKIHYALVLRNMRYGWTLDERRRYFAWFPEALTARGGASYQGFIKNIFKEALANTSEAERAALADLTGEDVQLTPPQKELPKPIGPGKDWTMAELLSMVEGGLRGRDFEKGKRSFHSGRCGTCHRFDGAGGGLGPDLTSVSGRFSYRDLLENVVEPSKVISDEYDSTIVVSKSGDVVVGRIVAEEDGKLLVAADSDNPENLTEIKKSDIVQTEPSKESLMPADLVDALNRDELLDLFAYLMSRGDPESPLFR